MLNSHLIRVAGAAGAPRGHPLPQIQFNLCASVNRPAWRVVRFVNLPLFQHKRRGVICLTETVEGERWPSLQERSNLLEVNARPRKDGATANYRSGGGSNYSVLFMSPQGFYFPSVHGFLSSTSAAAESALEICLTLFPFIFPLSYF